MRYGNEAAGGRFVSLGTRETSRIPSMRMVWKTLPVKRTIETDREGRNRADLIHFLSLAGLQGLGTIKRLIKYLCYRKYLY